MTKLEEEAPSNSVPADAVIRGGQAGRPFGYLSKLTGEVSGDISRGWGVGGVSPPTATLPPPIGKTVSMRILHALGIWLTRQAARLRGL